MGVIRELDMILVSLLTSFVPFLGLCFNSDECFLGAH